MATKRKYSAKVVGQIAREMREAHLAAWGNLTETAAKWDLTRHQLQGLIANYEAVRVNYHAAREELADRCEATYFRCGSGDLRGVNTQACGRILQALRPEIWNPVKRYEEVGDGYRRPTDEEKSGKVAASELPGGCSVVSGGKS